MIKLKKKKKSLQVEAVGRGLTKSSILNTDGKVQKRKRKKD